MTAVSIFRNVVRERLGVDPGVIVGDGRVHRFSTKPSGGDDAGWYALHDDNVAVGVFGCWRSGMSETWAARDRSSFTTVEREAYRQRIASLAAARDEERARVRGDAAARAVEIWSKAVPAANDHPYLKAKQVDAHGVRLSGDSLVVPVRINRELASLQFIGPDGTKKFLSGGAIVGGYHSLGRPDGVVVVCEGYATGATIHETTGHAVAVAFNAGNLKAVATAMRAKLPAVRIVIAVDDDVGTENNPGLAAARAAADSVGATLAVPPFDRQQGEEGSDWNDFAALRGSGAASAALDAALAAEANRGPKRPVVLDAQDLLEREFPPRGYLLFPILPERGLAMIVAARGIGKTWVGLNLAVAVGSGGQFLGWTAPKPRRVVYVDGEMPATVLQDRFVSIMEALDGNMPPENFQLIAADLQERGIPSIATPEGQAFLDFEVRAADLVILDNIATLCGTGDENVSDAWRPVQEWALRQRAAGRSVLFIHHAGKNGGQRGTSAREDVLDTVINLSRPYDYDTSQGARFEVHYPKARGFYGPDAEPFEARFADGVWTTGPIQKGEDVEALKAMKREGMSVRDIATRTGLSKSAVDRKLREVDDDT